MDQNTQSYGKLLPGELIRYKGFDPLAYPSNLKNPALPHLLVDQLYRVVVESHIPQSSSPYHKELRLRNEPIVFIAKTSLNEYYRVSVNTPIWRINTGVPVGWFEVVKASDLMSGEEKKKLITELWYKMHQDDRLFKRLVSLTRKY